MKNSARFLVIICILLPLILSEVLHISAQPFQVTAAREQASLAKTYGKEKQAIEALLILKKSNSQDGLYWEKLGAHYLANTEIQPALRNLILAEQFHILSDNGYLQLAEVYIQNNEPDAAHEIFQKLAQKRGHSEEFYKDLFQKAREARDISAALEIAENWLVDYRTNQDARWAVGSILAYQDYKAAIDVLNPLDVSSSAYRVKASALLTALKTGLEINNPAYTSLVVGQYLGNIGEWDIAEKAFYQSVDLDPDYAEAWALMGIAAEKNNENGYPYLEKAFSLDPSSNITLSALATYWREKQFPQKAITYLRILNANNPTTGIYLTEIAAIQAESGDLISAMETYQEAVAVNLDDAEVWRKLALFSASNGFDWEAYTLPAASQALELDPQGIETLDMAGWINLVHGDLKNAEQFLQQALKEDASYTPALYHLGQVYLKTNRLTEAYSLLQKAADLTQDEVQKLQIERLLDETLNEDK